MSREIIGVVAGERRRLQTHIGRHAVAGEQRCVGSAGWLFWCVGMTTDLRQRNSRKELAMAGISEMVWESMK